MSLPLVSAITPKAGSGGEPPVNVTPPSFTGTLTAGQTLTRVPGAWTGAPTPTIDVQWFSNGLEIDGATGNTLNSTGLGGTLISVGETAVNAVGTSTAVSTQVYLFTNEAARALVARITTPPADYWKSAYDGFYSTPNIAAVIAKADQMALPSGPNKQAAFLDLTQNRSLIESGTTLQTPSVGISANGASGYLLSGFVASSAVHYTNNDGGLAAYIAAGNNSPNNFIIAPSSGSSLFLLTNDSSSLSGRVNDGTSLTAANGGPTGLFVANRTASNAKEILKNGVSLATGSTASVGVTGASVQYLRLASSSYAEANTFASLLYIGASLNATDQTALKAGAETFNTLGRPRNFLLVIAGQSLGSLLALDYSNPAGPDGHLGSGDTTVNSNAQTRVLYPELQAYINTQYNDGRPNVLQILNTAVPGSGLLPGHGSFYSWWDLAGGGTAGQYAINDRAAVAAAKAATSFDFIIRIWIQGEAEAGSGDNGTNYINGCTGGSPSYNTGLFQYFRTGDGGATPIIVTPLGQNTSVPDAILAGIRDAQTTITANTAATYLGPETADTIRSAPNDWHPVSFNNSIYGFDRQCHWHARTLAHALSCTAVVWQGPEVASAAIVDSTHTDVTLTYPAGCGGTDFTPTSGIEGFTIFDAGVSKAISAAVRTDSTHVRLTHAAISGARTVQYVSENGNVSTANMVRDNFHGIPEGMPLRKSALLTAT